MSSQQSRQEILMIRGDDCQPRRLMAIQMGETVGRGERVRSNAMAMLWVLTRFFRARDGAPLKKKARGQHHSCGGARGLRIYPAFDSDTKFVSTGLKSAQ